MFDIGFWELVLIFVIALVVLGPERLPHAIRTVMNFVRTAKQMANSVKDELSQELKLNEIQENLRKAERIGIKDLPADVQESVDALKKAAGDIRSSAITSVPREIQTVDNESAMAEEDVPSLVQITKKKPE